jgi:hypothetical protein
VLGIPKEGTADYRTAALLVRAAVSGKDTFVAQVSQERLGKSPVMEARPVVELGWLFYEHRFSPSVSARAGKVKIPFGLFNEIRYVGPLLPFFRANDVFYGEGSYSFDEMVGATLSTHLFDDGRFSVDTDVYGGAWSFLQEDNRTPARVRGVGGQVWLNTPIRGLRAGLAGHRSTWRNVLRARGRASEHTKWAVSLDGNFTRVRVAAEYEKDGPFQAAYALASLRVNDKVALTAQASRAHLDLRPVPFNADLTRDYAVGVSYAPRRPIVFKVENHWAAGHRFDGVSLFAPSRRADYVIVSLSTLF